MNISCNLLALIDVSWCPLSSATTQIKINSNIACKERRNTKEERENTWTHNWMNESHSQSLKIMTTENPRLTFRFEAKLGKIFVEPKNNN